MSTSINLNGIDQLTLDFGGTTTAVLSSPGTITVTNNPSGSISGLTTGYIPVATSATSLGDSHIDDGVTNTGSITSTEPFIVDVNANDDEHGIIANNNSTGSAASSNIRIQVGADLSTTTGIYTVPSSRTPSGLIKPLSTYIGAAYGLTNGMVFSTETTAPIVLGTNSTAALTIDGSTQNVSVSETLGAKSVVLTNGAGGSVTFQDGSVQTTAASGSISIPASSKALASDSSSNVIAATVAGTGAALTTGPSLVVNGNIPSFTGATGQIQDSGIASSSLIQTTSSNIFTGQNQFRNNQSFSNVTASTSGANNSSYNVNISGTYFAGVSVTDTWTIQDVIGSGTNPTSTLTFSHTGSSGAAVVSVPNIQITNATTSTSATTGSATVLPALPLGYMTVYLNGTNVKIPYYSV